MSHLTRCPNCATTFRVSDAQLALRGGRVRCGHCSFVFNAQDCEVEADPVTIVDLRSDPSFLEHDPFWDPPADDSAPTAVEETVKAAPAPSDEGWPQILMADDDEPVPGSTDAAPGPSPAPESSPTPSTRALADSWLDDLEELPEPAWLRTPARPADGDAAPMPLQRAAEPDDTPPEVATQTEAPTPEELPSPMPAEVEPALSRVTQPRRDHDWLRPAGRSPWRWVWRGGCLVLLAAAVAMAALVWRQPVIEHYPSARPLLADACARLGCQVQAPQNMDLIEIDGVEFSFDPQDPQRLQLNAVLSNFAPYAQTWPLLDVQLKDRNGQRVARRVLRPVQYLPPELRLPGTEFDAQQEVQISVPLYLEGLAVESYTVAPLPSR